MKQLFGVDPAGSVTAFQVSCTNVKCFSQMHAVIFLGMSLLSVWKYLRNSGNMILSAVLMSTGEPEPVVWDQNRLLFESFLRMRFGRYLSLP